MVAGIYFAASRHMEFLYRQPLLRGVVFGAFVCSIMNSVVAPFSNTPMGDPGDARR